MLVSHLANRSHGFLPGMNIVSRRKCIKNKPFHVLKHFFSNKLNQTTQRSKKLDKALRVLDIISPKPVFPINQQNHLRLIQDFLQTDSNHEAFRLSRSKDGFFSVFEEISLPENSFLDKEETLSAVKDEWRCDASVLSYALSSCGSNRDFLLGIQYQCSAIKNGFVSNVYVGSSLVSFYSKCGELNHAYKVFDEMPEKNVVSWTAIISGFAQEWRVDVCLEIYSVMRNDSFSEPNDFTFTTILSACTGSGALGQGRSVHCQTIQMGFDSYVHISNALISMYCKCGSLEDASCIFYEMSNRDVVSWNSMIAGYAQHGLAARAIRLFKEMKGEKVKPDSITFLGVLSSCRHAGLVKEGWFYFKSMLKYGVQPELDHYSCLVDLLGRFGLLEEALELIARMPIRANAVIWGSLLSSCRVHGDVWIGIRAAESRLIIAPECAATHVQLANLYAGIGYWDEAARIRKQMKDKGLKTNPGCSWIEIKNDVHRFRPEDRANAKGAEILHVLDCLMDHMTTLGYVPETHEKEIEDISSLMT